MTLRRSAPAILPVLLLLLQACAPAPPPDAGSEIAPEDAYDGAHFKRVTLVVADLDRSLAIYRDILGFEIDSISESGPDSYSYPVFKIDPAATIRFATLSAGTEQVRTLGLTEVKGIELPGPSVPRRSATVIRTADIERDFARLEALGLETTEPKFVELTESYHFWERAFTDFDGHLIVLYQVVETVGD